MKTKRISRLLVFKSQDFYSIITVHALVLSVRKLIYSNITIIFYSQETTSKNKNIAQEETVQLIYVQIFDNNCSLFCSSFALKRERNQNDKS